MPPKTAKEPKVQAKEPAKELKFDENGNLDIDVDTFDTNTINYDSDPICQKYLDWFNDKYMTLSSKMHELNIEREQIVQILKKIQDKYKQVRQKKAADPVPANDDARVSEENTKPDANQPVALAGALEDDAISEEDVELEELKPVAIPKKMATSVKTPVSNSKAPVVKTVAKPVVKKLAAEVTAEPEVTESVIETKEAAKPPVAKKKVVAAPVVKKAAAVTDADADADGDVDEELSEPVAKNTSTTTKPVVLKKKVVTASVDPKKKPNQ